jgi:hypothetical protein
MAAAVWLLGPVPITVIVVAPELFVVGLAVQPAANTATAAGGALVRGFPAPPQAGRLRPLATGRRREDRFHRRCDAARAATKLSSNWRTGFFLTRAVPSASSLAASIVVTGPPLGVTEYGSNSQSIPSRKFEQENCTC